MPSKKSARTSPKTSEKRKSQSKKRAPVGEGLDKSSEGVVANKNRIRPTPGTPRSPG